MSHMVTVDVKLTNEKAILAAAKEMGLEAKKVTDFKFHRGEDKATGMSVKLNGWTYPIVIAKDGTIFMDNYNGNWGHESKLDEFKQQYSLASIKMAFGKKKLKLEKIGKKYKVRVAL